MLSNRKIPVPSIGSNFDNFKSKGVIHSIPILCMVALLLLSIIIINPIIYDKSFALEENEESLIEEQEAAETPDSSEDIEEINNEATNNADIATLSDEDNDSSAALIVDDGIIYDTILADAGSPVYKSHTITIKAANLESYVLQVSATNVGASELVNKDNSSIKVNGVGTSGVLGKNLPSGTWGIGWGDTSVADENLTYYTLPAYGTTASNLSSGLLESVTNITTDEINTTKKLTLAANFDPSTPDGHYTTSILLSLAIEPKKLTEFPITTMQEMTSNICASVAENTTKRLKDTRDGKYYWVTKLRDEACWMTQNLDYDGGGTGTDVVTLVKGTNFAESTQSQKIYYDPGNYVYTNGSTINTCNEATTDTGLSACTGKGWQYTSSIYMTSAKLPADDAEMIHYHAGNYYSWYTATNEYTESTADVDTSICPSGWKLPSGSNTTESFPGLLNGLKPPKSPLIPTILFMVETSTIALYVLSVTVACTGHLELMVAVRLYI